MTDRPGPLSFFMGLVLIIICGYGVSAAWDNHVVEQTPPVDLKPMVADFHAMDLEIQELRKEVVAFSKLANSTGDLCVKTANKTTTLNNAHILLNDWVNVLQGRTNGFREAINVSRWQVEVLQDYVNLPQEKVWIPDPLPSPWGAEWGQDDWKDPDEMTDADRRRAFRGIIKAQALRESRTTWAGP